MAVDVLWMRYGDDFQTITLAPSAGEAVACGDRVATNPTQDKKGASGDR